MNAARVAINDALQVKKDEKVLIITNPEEEVSEISQALYRASNDAGAKTVLVYQDIKNQLSFAEDCVIGAIGAAPDVLISMSHDKLGKDFMAITEPFEYEGKSINNTFHYLLKSKQTRSFWSPSTTIDMFTNMVPIDYARLKKEALWVKEIFDKAASIRVTAPGGTDITFGVQARKGMLDDGDFSRPGAGGNLPAGETFISPEVGSSEGVIVFDGSISSYNGIILIEEPIRVEYRNGFAVSVTGGKEAEELLKTITLAEENAIAYEKEGKIPAGAGEAYKKNARSLGELGIGLNPAATITGNMLGDEKVYKTCHFAIGSNYDDDAEALIHLDGLVLKPTTLAIMEDGKEVVITKDGKLNI
ncbi:MAG: aminopeptidase [Spirochaetales bacterium]|nr:aminopeptidase [Spirochaetales bacterium]